MKPMLATDWDEEKVSFPLWMEPKIDGVRAINLQGNMTGRSLKSFKNVAITEEFSNPYFKGFDGEMAAEDERHPRLCNLTTSALNTIKGHPYVLWHVFDFVTADTILLPYRLRWKAMANRVEAMKAQRVPSAEKLRPVPYSIVTSLPQIEEMDAWYLEQGYEGSILRDPDATYKFGRATVREGSYLRIKRFIEKEAVVKRVVEGDSNQNEATINALGQTERSTHMANMVPNGMVGALECVDMETRKDITVAAGCMDHATRRDYFQHQEKIVGQIIKYKTFPKGVKDKPRMPTFQSIRMKEDL